MPIVDLDTWENMTAELDRTRVDLGDAVNLISHIVHDMEQYFAESKREPWEFADDEIRIAKKIMNKYRDTRT